MKKKYIIFILIIFAFVIAIFTFDLYRKHNIISGIRKKLREYQTISNYSVNCVYRGNISNYYYKDKNNYRVDILGYVGAEGFNYWKYYNKNGTENLYIVSEDSRKALLNQSNLTTATGSYDSFGDYFENDYFERDSFIDYLKMLCKIRIKECEYRNKKMYKIDNLDKIPEFFSREENSSYSVYIEKDTGLINQVVDSGVYEIKFEFNNVDDDVLEEPNIELYEVVKE